MNILRTDGGGASSKDKRLKIVRNILLFHDVFNINLLHDHKGLLVVVWEKHPSDFEKKLVSNIWEIFNEYEIEHKIVTYLDL